MDVGRQGDLAAGSQKTCSGLMYAGVPRYTPVAVVSRTPSIRLAMPKSVTWGSPCESSSMFAGFRSRCKIPAHVGMVNRIRDGGHQGRHGPGIVLERSERRVETRSVDILHREIAMAFVPPHFVNRNIPGWSSCATASAWFWNRRRSSSSARTPALRFSFSATRRFRLTCLAL